MVALDPPLIARVREAARSALLTAAALRREHPARRAASKHAHVDIWPDGRLIALVVDDQELTGQHLVRHFTELYHAALDAGPALERRGPNGTDATPSGLADGQGVSPEPDGREIVVEPLFDVPVDEPASAPAIDLDPAEDAGEALDRAERQLAARTAGVRTLEEHADQLYAVAASETMRVELAGAGHLASLHLDPRTAAMPLDQCNAELASLVAQARADLAKQRQHLIQEGAR